MLKRQVRWFSATQDLVDKDGGALEIVSDRGADRPSAVGNGRRDRRSASAPRTSERRTARPCLITSPRHFFDETLARLGWVEGKNLTIERHFAMSAGEYETASEIVGWRPDVIVALGGVVGTGEDP